MIAFRSPAPFVAGLLLIESCVLFPVSPAAAQDPTMPTLGAFSFVNAVDAGVPSFLKVNERSYKIPGYQPGQMTISGLLQEGPTVFSVENAEVGRAEVAQPVAPGAPINLIAYAVEKKDEQTGESAREVKLIKAPSRPSKEFKWTGIYVSGRTNSASIYVGKTPVMLPPMKSISLPARGSIEIGLKPDEEPVIRATPDQPAHYVVVAYDKVDGGLGLALIPDAPQPE